MTTDQKPPQPSRTEASINTHNAVSGHLPIAERLAMMEAKARHIARDHDNQLQLREEAERELDEATKAIKELNDRLTEQRESFFAQLVRIEDGWRDRMKEQRKEKDAQIVQLREALEYAIDPEYVMAIPSHWMAPPGPPNSSASDKNAVNEKIDHLTRLLDECHPFLIHAACTIPDSNPEYKKAHDLMKIIDPIVNAEVYQAFENDRRRQAAK